MIVKPLVGTFPNLAITISDAPVDYQSINTVEILLSENMHDSLAFEMSGIPVRAVTDYADAPVRVEMTMSGQSFTFVGYVNDVLPVATTSHGLVNSSPFQTARIVCMGASYDMRGTSSRTFTDYTLRDVIDRYVDQYRISVDIPHLDTRRGLSVQGTRSDWKFLVDEVQRNALAMTLHGTHLHIYDPYAALSRTGAVVSLTTLKATGMDTATYPGQILEFKGRFGTRSVDGKYKENLVTVLGPQGNSFTVSTGTGQSRFKSYIGDYGTTYSEAMQLAEADRKQHYDYEADVQIVGIVGATPGSVVNLDQYQNPDFDGYWYVREVKHRVATGAYLTDLSIARNKDTNLVKDGTLPLRTPPAPAYIGGRWRASEERVREY